MDLKYSNLTCLISRLGIHDLAQVSNNETDPRAVRLATLWDLPDVLAGTRGCLLPAARTSTDRSPPTSPQLATTRESLLVAVCFFGLDESVTVIVTE